MNEKKEKISNSKNEQRKFVYEEGYIPRIVVQFQEGIKLPYKDGIEKYITEQKIGPWRKLEQEFPGIRIKRLVNSLSSEKITELVNKATKLDSSYRPSNFFNYFIVELPKNLDPNKLIKSLSSWETIKNVYFDPPGSDPSVNPVDDPRSVNQGYIGPAPNGIDARFAWTVANGDGTGIKVIDLERGWTLNHEDLTAQNPSLLHGTNRNGSRYHGTAVLGEICAVDNTRGCIGIAPNIASINAVSYWGSNRVSAILSAISNLSFGDVLLLEAQLSIPRWNNMPIEVLDPEFAAIRLATALGIVVVEAAGNGGNDLDTYVDGSGRAIFNRASAGFRDSGAIMVGATSSASPHTRMGFSNFGSRIDCYAWGENVDTCYSNTTGSTTMYTGTFSGTSSASPIITGAAMIVQSVAQERLGNRFNPLQLRQILSDSTTGTPSKNPANDRVGVMPDLRAIINTHIKQVKRILASSGTMLIDLVEGQQIKWKPAVPCWKHPNWYKPNSKDIANGVVWIWSSDWATQEEAEKGAVRIFSKKFNLKGTGTIISAEMKVAADNKVIVILNGDVVKEVENFKRLTKVNVKKYLIQETINELKFIVINRGGITHVWPLPTPRSNPAGLIYKLEITTQM